MMSNTITKKNVLRLAKTAPSGLQKRQGFDRQIPPHVRGPATALYLQTIYNTYTELQRQAFSGMEIQAGFRP